MNRESFLQRVQTLRESWSERRQVRALASSHDFESQFQLLAMLHAWARDAVQDVQEVYGDELSVELGPEPGHEDRNPGFTITLAPGYSAALVLVERQRTGASHWFVSVTLNSAGPGASAVSAGPQRRTGQWTRGQLEDLVLSLLGAYERSIAGGADSGT